MADAKKGASKKVEVTKKDIPIENKKKGGAIKVVIAIIITFILIPGLLIVGFYFINDTFEYRMNAALAESPGSIGTYFDSIPTREEKNGQIKSIAEYFLDISIDRSVDKLILINNDEPEMYNDIIKIMLQMDPNDTKVILESIRTRQRKGDAVSTTLEQIIEENNIELGNVAVDLQNIPFSTLKSEMYKIINDGLNGASHLAKILEQMNSLKAFELLSLLDEVDREDVMNSMSTQVKDLINEEMNKNMSNNQKLISLSEIYSSKDTDELIDILGNTNTYTVDELAVIFKEVGILKTGEILSKVSDSLFLNDVIYEMKNNEVLENGEDIISKDILKTLKIYKDFDDNILQLTNIYSTMQSEEISNILKRLLTNGALPQVYVLDSGDIITITDEELALKILKNFDNKKIAEILGYYRESLASEISKKMTVPEY